MMIKCIHVSFGYVEWVMWSIDIKKVFDSSHGGRCMSFARKITRKITKVST